MTAGPDHASSAKAIEACAVEWLIARDEQQTWSEDDQRRLDAWLAESPAHQTAFWRVEAGWNRAELIADIGPFGLGTKPPQPGGFPWLAFLRIAASFSIFAIIGIGSLIYFTRPQFQTFTTPVGGRKLLTLFDGSKIELNTNTELRIGINQRDAELVSGEAFFQIHHDASHPFSVSVAGHRVVDLGTQFLIRSNGSDLRVALMEGKARLEAESGSEGQVATLTPGDVALANATSLAISRKSTQELHENLAWRKGILVFDDTPLTEAAEEFNRYNDVKIVIADAQAAHMKVNGSIHVNDGREFARLAQNLFGLQAERHGNEILIGTQKTR